MDSLFLLGEGASPFIDKGDGLTSERERVHMLLSLVAHAGGYRKKVGADNTILGSVVPGMVAGYCLAGAQGMVPVLWL